MHTVSRNALLPAAPIDLRGYGVEVDPQLAFFGRSHVVVAAAAVVQGAVACIILWIIPKPTYVRKHVLAYNIATLIFSATYALTGHTYFSNFLAVAHNHWEIQLVAFGLARRESWTKYNRLSKLYYGFYAVLTAFSTVKTGRRVWTLVGLVWDMLLPVVYTLRAVVVRRNRIAWLCGAAASFLHLASILILLSLKDGVAQYFSLLLAPSTLAWSAFAIKLEHSKTDFTDILLHVHPDKRVRAVDHDFMHLPDRLVVAAVVTVLVFTGVPAVVLLYGDRLLQQWAPQL